MTTHARPLAEYPVPGHQSRPADVIAGCALRWSWNGSAYNHLRAGIAIMLADLDDGDEIPLPPRTERPRAADLPK
ncbi:MULTISPECIES: hypothetical protein [Pseudofrankia]|uniref:hypothetical protein n=1 Tax=Pseudofrankia TaxID=2994363 RepID=UPI000234B942|nr:MULTISPECIES: hypothetical protein [Pseudofrankia]OHV32100.1 hypothetical protein BCD49_31110 [Pseudofrankia sp. EUN1h]